MVLILLLFYEEHGFQKILWVIRYLLHQRILKWLNLSTEKKQLPCVNKLRNIKKTRHVMPATKVLIHMVLPWRALMQLANGESNIG